MRGLNDDRFAYRSFSKWPAPWAWLTSTERSLHRVVDGLSPVKKLATGAYLIVEIHALQGFLPSILI